MEISRKQYIETGGCSCPICGSRNIDRGTVVVTASQLVSQNVRCMNCTASWTNGYILNDINKVCIGTASNITVV